MRDLEKEVKREALKALLKVKPSEEWTLSRLSMESRLPKALIEEAISELGGLVTVERGAVRMAEGARIRIAALCLTLGSDASYVSSLLDWREFEEFISSILGAYGYTVYHGFRFKSLGRRWEVDILALRQPVILCLDCKHYIRQRWFMLQKAASECLRRAEALKEALKNLNLKPKPFKGWWILPGLVTLLKPRVKIYRGIPIVQVTELRSFLEELLPYKSVLKTLPV